MSAEGGLGALLGAYGSDSDEQDRSPEVAPAAAAPADGSPAAASPAGHANAAEAMQIDAEAAQPPEAAEAPGLGPAEGPARPPPEGPSAKQPLPASPLAALAARYPPPPGEADPEVQARVARWLELQRATGRRLTDTLRASRDYRNPEFFRKMIEYWEIEEHGTALPREAFDPGALPAEDTIDALKAEGAAEEERRRAARAEGTGRIEFAKGGTQAPPPQSAAATAAAVAAAQAIAARLAAGHRR